MLFCFFAYSSYKFLICSNVLEFSKAELEKSNEELALSLAELQQAYEQAALTQEELNNACFSVSSPILHINSSSAQMCRSDC